MASGIENQRIKAIVKHLIADGFVQNQQDFAQKMGYTSVSLSQLLNGHREVSRPFLDKLFINFPNINKEYLLYGKGEMFTNVTGSGNVIQAGIVQGNNMQNADCAEQLKMALNEISEQRKLYASHIDRLLSIIENNQNK